MLAEHEHEHGVETPCSTHYVHAPHQQHTGRQQHPKHACTQPAAHLERRHPANSTLCAHAPNPTLHVPLRVERDHPGLPLLPTRKSVWLQLHHIGVIFEQGAFLVRLEATRKSSPRKASPRKAPPEAACAASTLELKVHALATAHAPATHTPTTLAKEPGVSQAGRGWVGPTSVRVQAMQSRA